MKNFTLTMQFPILKIYWRLRVLLMCFLLLLGNTLNAQNANQYSFSAFSGSFTPLVGGTPTSLSATADDAISSAFPIGFTFNFAGTNYTTVQASSNGPLLFGSGRSQSATNNLATTTATQRPGLAPLWDDLQATSGVTYQLSGSPGSQILIVEWLNMEWNWSSTVGISFQVKLYEGSNIIEYIYQQEAGGNPSGSSGASIGLMGIVSTDFLSLTNASSSPGTSTVTSTNTITTKPATGQVYQFTQPPPPSCGSPGSLTAEAAFTTADLAWSAPIAGTPITYNWEVRTSGLPGSGATGLAASGTVNHPSTSVTATGLSSMTSYSFYVMTDCGISGTSSWVGPTTFSTANPALPNDICSGAINLTVNPNLSCAVSTPGTIAGATASSGATGCFGTADDDVWYTFVATTTTHIVNLINVSGSTTDLYHVIYSGTCGNPGTPIKCSDPNTSTTTGLVSGNTYYVRVYTWTSTAGQTTTFDICVGTLPPPPSNDECVNAISLTVNNDLICSNATAGSIASATASSGATGCSGTADDDVWYSFVATSTTHIVDLINVSGSTTDLYHAIYSGSCGALGTPIKCSDPNTSTTTGLVIGNTYYVRVYSWTSTAGQTTTFDICVGTLPPPPANDECAGAINLTVNSGLNCGNVTSGSVVSATASAGATGCSGTADDDVWYSFIATSTTHIVNLTNVSGSTTDLYHVVYGGSCGALTTPLVCSDPNNSIVTGLTVGNTYYVRVYTWTSTAGQTTSFDICVGTPPPPHDLCTDAVVVSCGSTHSSITSSPLASNDNMPDMCGAGSGTQSANGVWYKYIGDNMTVTASLCGSGFDTRISVYSGNCLSLNCVGGNDDFCSTQSQTTFNALTGTDYYILVHGFSTNSGIFTLDIACEVLCLAPNDVCVTAQNLPVQPQGGGVFTSGNNECATPSPLANTGCGGSFSSLTDVFYSFNSGSGAAVNLYLDNTGVSAPAISGTYFYALYDGCTSGDFIDCETMTLGSASTISGLSANTDYYLRIYGSSTSTYTQGNFNIMVEAINPPACITAPDSPLNGATGCPGSTTFDWSAITGATGYDVYLDTNNPPTTQVGNNQTGTSYTTSLAGLTTYYWQVVPRNIGGAAQNCTVWSYNTSGPQITITADPVGGAICGGTGSVTLTASGADTYSWSPSGGLNTTLGAIVEASPMISTTYTVTGTLNGCTNTASYTVNVVPGVQFTAYADDAQGCAPFTTGLNADVVTTGDYTGSSIAFAPIPGSGTAVSLGDDAASGILSIGFSFEFFDNSYSNFYLNSNGTLNFGSSSSTLSNQVLPNSSAPNNLIAFAWDDLNPSAGGSINYFTSGSAPNRILVVNYINVPHFNSSSTVTVQLQLHEGTDAIQFHNIDIQSDGLGMTQGIENIDGTIAYAVPGRNDVAFTASNDAYQFAPISFTYSWDNATYLDDANISHPIVSGLTDDQIFTVVVSNNFGCSATASVSISVEAVPTPVISPSDFESLCEGESITFNTQYNAIDNYQFSWGDLNEPGEAFTTGIAGNYTMTVSSANGCESDPVPFTVQVATIFADAVADTINCYGGSDGVVEILVLGTIIEPGNDVYFGPFDYSINGGPLQSSPIFTGLSAGLYDFGVHDPSTGCVLVIQVQVYERDPLIVTTNVLGGTTCYGGSDGSASANATGGVGPYTFDWLTPVPKSGEQNNEIPGGTWTVVVTDANGCTSTTTVTISEPDPIIVSLGDDRVVPYGTAGSFNYSGCTDIIPVISGAVLPYQNISWSTGATTQTINVCNPTPGIDAVVTYTLTVIDANGCVGEGSVTLIYASIDCSNNSNGTKVKICNVPPGNPSNCNTICVSVNAASALLANGSYVGQCNPGCAPARTMSPDPVAEKISVHVMPNPTTGRLLVDFISETQTATSIKVMDLQGRVVMNVILDGSTSFTQEVDLSNLDTGLYILNIMNNDGLISTSRVVKAE